MSKSKPLILCNFDATFHLEGMTQNRCFSMKEATSPQLLERGTTFTDENIDRNKSAQRIEER